MIGIDSKHFAQDGAILAQAFDTSLPKKVATARLTARRIPENLLHVARKLDPGLAQNLKKKKKAGPENARKTKKSQIYLKFFEKLHLLWFE